MEQWSGMLREKGKIVRTCNMIGANFRDISGRCIEIEGIRFKLSKIEEFVILNSSIDE